MSLDEILALAPADLPSHRPTRYPGGLPGLLLGHDFTEDERIVIRRQYETLGRLETICAPRPGTERIEDQSAEFHQFPGRTEIFSLEDQLHSILREGQGVRSRSTLLTLSQIASGAFEGVCDHLLLAEAGGLEPEYLLRLHYLARDHRKVMRALLADLDPAERLLDTQPKLHHLDLLLEKWRGAAYHAFKHKITITFDNHFQGPIAERSLEFAELDRLFYHLANNCARHSSDHRLHIAVAPTPDARNLRWVFTSGLAPAKSRALEKRLSRSESLFTYQETARSGRLGLGSVADAILHAYGLEDRTEAERQGYFGVRVTPDRFLLWFHWPAIDPTAAA